MNAARRAGASRTFHCSCELTINQRAQHPADRHAQALFRNGEIEYAIRTYAARDHVHIDSDQQHAEDQALEAAQRDRTEGKSTIVIAQTSNEHLNELNARAQAIRKQHRELGDKGLSIPGRPYALHDGDQVQVRHTITHPDHGQLRNGTVATVSGVNPRSSELTLTLGNGEALTVDREQIEQADLRLAYVQHPFPTQGHTTDTAHVIIIGQTTREGTYVAITRAREQTDIYAGANEISTEGDPVGHLADRVSQSEPEVPSISTPLAHETILARSVELEASSAASVSLKPNEIEREPVETLPRQAAHEVEPSSTGERTIGSELHDGTAQEQLQEESGPTLEEDGRHAGRAANTEAELTRAPKRVWPTREASPEPDGPEWDADQLERDQTPGWEL